MPDLPSEEGDENLRQDSLLNYHILAAHKVEISTSWDYDPAKVDDSLAGHCRQGVARHYRDNPAGVIDVDYGFLRRAAAAAYQDYQTE